MHVAPLRCGDATICVGSPQIAAVLQAMDQLLFAPPFVALNFATLKVLEVRVLQAAAGRLRSTDAFSCVRSSHVRQQSSACVLNSRMSPLQGKPGEAVPKLKQDWKDAIVANWKLWPVFQFVNFRFVPPEQRVRAMGTDPDECKAVFLLHVSSTVRSH
jgi:Mpv17 / PMP22 family